MTPEPSPHWNQLLLSLDAAEELVKAATFVIRLGKQVDDKGRTYYEWGTGFFFWCSKDGLILALTADHNLRPYQRKRYFSACYQGSWVTLEWVKGWSSEKADIAVMRLHHNPNDVKIETLPVAYLDSSVPLRARKQFWGGREILIYGYPFRGTGQVGWPIAGAIDLAAPLITSLEIEQGGYSQRIEKNVQRLNMQGSRVRQLEAISGAAILERELRLVIGVEGAYEPETGDVRGTEIAQLVDEHPELKQYFQPLLSAQEKPEKGIGVVVRRESEPIPGIIPVSVQFCPGGTTSGDVTSDHQAIRNQVQLALGWVGEYVRRFRGNLRRVLEENHWGVHKPYNCPLFHLPEGNYISLPSIQAGMALAYLAKALSDALKYDLELPIAFPQSLLLCAAGFDNDSLAGEAQLADALQQFQFQAPATVSEFEGRFDGFARTGRVPQACQGCPSESRSPVERVGPRGLDQARGVGVPPSESQRGAAKAVESSGDSAAFANAGGIHQMVGTEACGAAACGARRRGHRGHRDTGRSRSRALGRRKNLQAAVSPASRFAPPG